MSENIAVFAFDQQFLTVIALLASAFVSVHICFGQNTRKAREYCAILFLLLALAVQYYHLSNAVAYVPSSQFFTFSADLIRLECKQSNKGGKRVVNSEDIWDINPCYCNSAVGVCKDFLSGGTIVGDCPFNSTAICQYVNSTEVIDQYLSINRNCHGGQGRTCTKKQPCFPCDMDSVVVFGGERCRTCSTDNKGDCNFTPDLGPYCYSDLHSKKAVPCKKCCTEPEPPRIINGTCY